jgi:hypothetical protein
MISKWDIDTHTSPDFPRLVETTFILIWNKRRYDSIPLHTGSGIFTQVVSSLQREDRGTVRAVILLPSFKCHNAMQHNSSSFVNVAHVFRDKKAALQSKKFSKHLNTNSSFYFHV